MNLDRPAWWLFPVFFCFLQRPGRTAQRDCSDTTLWDPMTTSPRTGTVSSSWCAVPANIWTAHVNFHPRKSKKTFWKLLPSKGSKPSVHLVKTEVTKMIHFHIMTRLFSDFDSISFFLSLGRPQACCCVNFYNVINFLFIGLAWQFNTQHSPCLKCQTV